MDGDFFYVVGILLVIAAVVLSYLGIRGPGSFPPNRGILVAVTGVFAAVVVVTLAFAVDLSEEEQAHREAELAHEEAVPENEGQNEPPASPPRSSRSPRPRMARSSSSRTGSRRRPAT
jgi:hypothetical protein